MDARPPLADLRVALVGPGRVGVSLAGWLAASGARLEAVAGRRTDAERATLLGFGRAIPLDELTSVDCDLLLVAVGDEALAGVVATLAARPQAGVALHTCGSRGASALSPLRRPGRTAVGSLHPLRAFPVAAPQPLAARETLLAIDGDPPAVGLARRLAAAWGARVADVPDGARLIYHFAATLAAGGVVTLLATAAELARRAGLGPEVTAGYVELARGAVAAAGAVPDPAQAITGPVARGDGDLVLRELTAVAETAPELARIGRELAAATLAALARHGSLTPAQQALQAALAEELATGEAESGTA